MLTSREPAPTGRGTVASRRFRVSLGATALFCPALPEHRQLFDRQRLAPFGLVVTSLLFSFGCFVLSGARRGVAVGDRSQRRTGLRAQSARHPLTQRGADTRKCGERERGCHAGQQPGGPLESIPLRLWLSERRDRVRLRGIRIHTATGFGLTNRRFRRVVGAGFGWKLPRGGRWFGGGIEGRLFRAGP